MQRAGIQHTGSFRFTPWMKKTIQNYLPIFGILAFLMLYAYASTLYPGGSQANEKSVGFDWVHNYWCNLMNIDAINGTPNPARPFANSAMVILCISFISFFVQFSEKFAVHRSCKIAIKYGGIISMIFASLIATSHHDFMTIISSFFGLFAVVGIMVELYRSDMHWYKISGIGCIVLLLVNNIIYYSSHFIHILPLLQKITFVFIFAWIIGLHFEIVKKANKE